MGYREEGQFEAGGDAGFVEDVGQVAFYRFLAERELLGDVAVTAAFYDATNNVEFARGEAVGFALRWLGLAHEVMQGRDEVHYTLAADPVITGIDSANGCVERASEGIFQDNAACADVERLNDLLSSNGGGKKDNFDRGRAIHDGAHGFKAGQARHLDVEQKDVGGLLQSLGDSLITIVSFSYDFEAVALGEHVTYTDADYRMIVGQYDANGLLFHESPTPPKSRD
jgi:hypothetical protein